MFLSVMSHIITVLIYVVLSWVCLVRPVVLHSVCSRTNLSTDMKHDAIGLDSSQATKINTWHLAVHYRQSNGGELILSLKCDDVWHSCSTLWILLTNPNRVHEIAF